MKETPFEIYGRVNFLQEGKELGTSLVQDYREDSFLVTIPLQGYRKKLLVVGEWITGLYYDTKGKVYMFRSKVLGREIQNIPMYRLSIPDNLYKVQRRHDVRVPLTIPVQIALLPSAPAGSRGGLRLAEEEGPVLWENATALDLSGGGVNLSTTKPLETGERVRIRIDTDGLNMELQGKVMRCRLKIISGLRTYRIGVKFMEITERDRDRVIRYVFRKLVDRRKKVLEDEYDL